MKDGFTSAVIQHHYTQALAFTPAKLMAEECSPWMFQHLERVNSWFAAKRLARYWTLRSSTFGTKKFDFLHQTGEGALSRREITVVASGFVQLLPYDAEGCSVVLIDAVRLQEVSWKALALRRLLFYIFNVASENEQSRKCGVVLLLHMGDSLDKDKIVIDFLRVIALSFALRCKSVHLLSGSTGLIDL